MGARFVPKEPVGIEMAGVISRACSGCLEAEQTRGPDEATKTTLASHINEPC